MIELFDVLTIPTWAIAYLENNDLSGLTDNELEILQQWERDKIPAGAIFNWPDDSERGFYHYNDITLQGADCFQVPVYAPFPFQFKGGAK